MKARTLRTRIQTWRAKYCCPVCDSRVAAFLPLASYYSDNLHKHGWPFAVTDAETCNEKNYECPVCHASDRDRLYALYLRAYVFGGGPGGEFKIIDFAPSAPLSDFIRRRISESGITVSYRTADAFAPGVDDQVDITNLKIYDDAQFDFFICSHVLEHVADDRQALRELHRILKPGGHGILMVPIILSVDHIDEDPSVVDEGERWRRFGQDDHVRLYSKSGFIGRVQEAGFAVHEFGRDFFGTQEFARFGITNQSVLYVVQK